MIGSKWNQALRVGVSAQRAGLLQTSTRLMAVDFKDKEKGEEKVYFNKQDCKKLVSNAYRKTHERPRQESSEAE